MFVLLSAIASEFDIDLERAMRTKFVGADSRRTWATANPIDEE